ncbi:Hypothetical predicted protein [Mytilus galloprovincialis]|uniref:Mab-21-like HhH/H2TH-like domain-containing protein n=2 Tax=Mytilus galloprovincialis TaxID=29158 RepID=A0A8B6DCR1_MYTGA|nr:Hypothetical predicted protein [Mytilus galloprovincialis]
MCSDMNSLEVNENIFGMKKISYWEIYHVYGVKRFPYPGNRKHSIILSRSFSGQIIITNDAFGMTIHQFEREYKQCLKRRFAKEQWILHLQYPIKSSQQYLEYLEKCTCHNEGYITCQSLNLIEKRLFDYLVNAVGTEIEIRKRQRLFVLRDKVDCKMNTEITFITSGSIAEGLDLPGSDLDQMFLINGVEIVDENIADVRCFCTTLVMEITSRLPGFVKLRLVHVGEVESQSIFNILNCIKPTDGGLYLSTKLFISNIAGVNFSSHQVTVHGPCISQSIEAVDFAYGLRIRCWPNVARRWIYRHRQQWPCSVVMNEIIQSGCLVVAVGPKHVEENDFLWRLSFSISEKKLLHSFNYTQLLCYGLLKLTLKRFINKIHIVKDLLCSYFIKTSLFWLSEELSIEIFRISNLLICFNLCLDKLMIWVRECYCPNYFIPEHNMFLGKVNYTNNKPLLQVLQAIKNIGIENVKEIFLQEDRFTSMYPRLPDTYYLKLDILFYKLAKITAPKHEYNCYLTLNLIESLLKFETSAYIIGICENFKATVNQYLIQWLPLPIPYMSSHKEMYHSNKSRHKYLKNGLMCDAVSGWILYASFYYNEKQYNESLKIADYILSRCIPGLLRLHRVAYPTNEIMKYSQELSHKSEILISDRMRLFTIYSVRFLRYSPLIPDELKLEVDMADIYVPPLVMCNCLRFLCYHHLGDDHKKQQALEDLRITILKRNVLPMNQLSDSLTILGVCYKLNGNKEAAIQCYDEAFRCEGRLCTSTRKRKLQIL